MMVKVDVCVLVVLLCISVSVAKLPRFIRGRPRDGFVGNPPITENTPKDLPPEEWFTQRLDQYNDADTKRWQQKYYTNAQFYKPGGPIFLMLGGEGPLAPIWMVEGAWVDYAKKYNAMLFSIEHRYYGKSHPVPDMSVDHMPFCSSTQALGDSAAFIQFVKQKYNLQKSKLITFGGSYSGSLSAWMRLKYPHLVDGAVATSAPLLALLDFKDYLAVTTASLDTTGPGCNDNIAMATKAVELLIQTQTGRIVLKSMFKLCQDLDLSNKWDIDNFYASLAGNFEGVVQYNKDNRAFEGGAGSNITIDTICGIMNDESIGTPLQRYATVNNLMLSTYEQPCLDFSYTNMIEELQKTSWNGTNVGGRAWTYQTCTEFGFFQSSDLEKQPFGHGFPISFSIQQCIDIFGAKFNADLINTGINRTNINYGAQNIKASKIVFPNGSIDQWHVLGKLTDLPEGSTAILINGTAHCANMYPASPRDSQDLINARIQIEKLIGEWIQ